MNVKLFLASVLHRLGVSAGALTVLGFLAAFASGYLIYRGLFFWGATVLLLAGGLDLLDGAVARMSPATGRFGGILDSSLDRYGDAFAFGGIFFFCAFQEKYLYAALAFSALLGSFAVSYVRARAECEFDDCRTGFWERGERVAYLALGLLLNNLALALWVLGIGTHWTAARRLARARILDRGIWGSPPERTDTRRSPAYLLKAGFWLLLLFLVHPAF